MDVEIARFVGDRQHPTLCQMRIDRARPLAQQVRPLAIWPHSLYPLPFHPIASARAALSTLPAPAPLL